MSQRQAWRRWPKRRAVRCYVVELAPRKWRAEYVLDCGHITWREGTWVGPFPPGVHEMRDGYWRAHCGSCFHGFPAGHASPYDGKTAFFEQFEGGVQLSFAGLDDG